MVCLAQANLFAGRKSLFLVSRLDWKTGRLASWYGNCLNLHDRWPRGGRAAALPVARTKAVEPEEPERREELEFTAMIREATPLEPTFGTPSLEITRDFHLGSARMRQGEPVSQHESAESEISRLTWAVLDGRATAEQRLRLATLVRAQHERRHREAEAEKKSAKNPR